MACTTAPALILTLTLTLTLTLILPLPLPLPYQVGVHKQPDGRMRVGLNVPTGRLSVAEARSIARTLTPTPHPSP